MRQKLDKRMDLIYPFIILIHYKILKTVMHKISEEAEVSLYAIYNVMVFDPLLKCYLMELMFMDGIDGLVLAFAAYLTTE